MATNRAIDRIAAQRALIDAVEIGPDGALTQLRGKQDPDSLHAQLDILLQARRYSDAAKLVLGVAPHPAWSDLALTALVMDGQSEAANRLFCWAIEQPDVILRRRCALAHAEAAFCVFCRDHENTNRLLIAEPTPEEVAVLRGILRTLDVIVPVVLANGKADSRIESMAIQYAIRCHFLLREREQADSLASILATRRPLPLGLAQLSLDHVVRPADDWPQRLRAEHPQVFDAQVLAAAIEGMVQHKRQLAFDAACALVPQAATPEAKTKLYALLNTLQSELGSEADAILDPLVPGLIGDVPDLLAMRQAERLLRQQDADSAKVVLDGVNDKADPAWLQLHAYYLIQKEDPQGALKELVLATASLPVPGLLSQTASIAYQAGDLKTCIEMLKAHVLMIPGDVNTRRKLASVLVDASDYSGAAEQFNTLRRLDSSDPWHGYNQAICLSHAGRDQAALDVYDSLCDDTDPSMPVYLARASLLQQMDRAPDAFATLNKVRGALWDAPNYLIAYVNAAFAANAEAEAGEALAQLNRLRTLGRVDPQLFRLASLDEIKEEMKGFRQRQHELNQELLKGKLPWLVVDNMSNQPSYRAWASRTQPIRWLFDDPDARAELCVYATNSFTVCQRPDGTKSLDQIECPPADTRIIADITALMTLHRLDLLPMTAEYFGAVELPSLYDYAAFQDRMGLLTRQPSERAAIEELCAALDRKQISVCDDVGTVGHRPIAYLNEHTFAEDDKEHYYRLRDALLPLHEAGLVQETLFRDAMRMGSNPSAVDDGHPPLKLGDKLLVHDLTLITLSKAKVLSAALTAFCLSISSEDAESLRATLRSYNTLDAVKRWHADLWAAIKDNPKFVHATCRPLRHGKVRTGPVPAEPFLIAIDVATNNKIPLLTDDRCCQAIALNAAATDVSAAFGTDALIIAMWKHGLLTIGQAADAFLKLLDWRYRFLVLPKEVLKELCDRYAEHPPGVALLRVSNYVHDCMRDPGLFGGAEPTDPPVSIAYRLFQQWTASIVDFAVDVWDDSRYDEAHARALTDWAMKEFLPSPPKCLGAASSVVASFSHQMVVNRAMLRAAFISDVTKANAALRAISASLGLTTESFQDLAMGVLNAG